MNQTELEKLIKSAKSGNQVAYNALLEHFWNDVYAFQLKRLQNEFEAEEITIQTFSKAFDKLDTYNSEYKFKTWLITISKNIHIDTTRVKTLDTTSVHRMTTKAIADESLDAENQLILEQNLQSLLQHLKRLKPSYEEIIRLRFFKEMSYKEIAEQLDEPLNNVKVKLLRAKKLLAESIKSSSAL